MTLIPVEFLSITDDPGYATPEAAIAASMAHPLQPMAQEAGSLFAGREFVTAWCTPDEWVLEFTGPLWLRIVAERSGVRWSVERGRPDVPSVNEPYTLEWDSGGRTRVEPIALLDARRGATFRQFWVDRFGFYVYLRRRLILCFGAARRRDNGIFVLHVWEEV